MKQLSQHHKSLSNLYITVTWDGLLPLLSEGGATKVKNELMKRIWLCLLFLFFLLLFLQCFLERWEKGWIHILTLCSVLNTTAIIIIMGTLTDRSSIILSSKEYPSVWIQFRLYPSRNMLDALCLRGVRVSITSSFFRHHFLFSWTNRMSI